MKLRDLLYSVKQHNNLLACGLLASIIELVMLLPITQGHMVAIMNCKRKLSSYLIVSDCSVFVALSDEK